MKKILLLLVMIGGMATFTSCNDDDEVVYAGDGDTISEVYEVSNVNFRPDNTTGIWASTIPLNLTYNSDMVLVYRLAGLYQGEDVWEMLPRTEFLGGESEVEFDFNFRMTDVEVTMNPLNVDLTLFPEFTQNQVYRIVIIPGYVTTAGRMDYRDLKTTMAKFNLKEADVKKINK
jgi:hypothetical protein